MAVYSHWNAISRSWHHLQNVVCEIITQYASGAPWKGIVNGILNSILFNLDAWMPIEYSPNITEWVLLKITAIGSICVLIGEKVLFNRAMSPYIDMCHKVKPNIHDAACRTNCIIVTNAMPTMTHQTGVSDRSVWVSECSGPIKPRSWWRYDMKSLSALLALCEGNPPVTGGFPSQRASCVERGLFLAISPEDQLKCE